MSRTKFPCDTRSKTRLHVNFEDNEQDKDKGNPMVFFTGNVDSATMRVENFAGDTYLVGPVIMAREQVMNGLLYPNDELRESVPHWNGRPVVKGHPHDADGEAISANDTGVFESDGLGYLYNSRMISENRLASEVWIKQKLLKNHSDIKTAMDKGEVLEVSTGLFLHREAKKGKFNGKSYNAIARNYKPDHLAILVGEKGACSVDDGAGFPRINSAKAVLEVNELSGGEKHAVIGRALKKSFSVNGWSAWLEDLYDSYAIFSRYDSSEGMYNYYKVSYTLADDEQTVTFTDEPKKVIMKKTYVDMVANTVIQKEPVNKAASAANSSKGEKEMHKLLTQLVADKFMTNEEATALGDVTDAVAQGLDHAFRTHSADKPGTEKPVTEKPVTPVPQGNKDQQEWASKAYAKARKEACDTITANKHNTLTPEQLDEMPLTQLEAIAAMASNSNTDGTTDMSAVGSVVEQNSKKPKAPAEVAPYVPKSL